jgi:hypothetical protein
MSLCSLSLWELKEDYHGRQKQRRTGKSCIVLSWLLNDTLSVNAKLSAKGDDAYQSI